MLYQVSTPTCHDKRLLLLLNQTGGMLCNGPCLCYDVPQIGKVDRHSFHESGGFDNIYPRS